MITKEGLKQILDELQRAQQNFNEFDADPAKLEWACDDIQKRLMCKLKTGRCSNGLIIQMARHRLGIGERFLDKIEFYHAPSICDVIEAMENRHIAGQPFLRSEKLRGLYKVHHNQLNQAHSLLLNVWNKIPNGAQFTLAEMNAFHSNTIREKAMQNKLTGEWLVYTEINRINYYLCLATHEEGRTDDALIYARILLCINEFPELSFLANSSAP